MNELISEKTISVLPAEVNEVYAYAMQYADYINCSLMRSNGHSMSHLCDLWNAECSILLPCTNHASSYQQNYAGIIGKPLFLDSQSSIENILMKSFSFSTKLMKTEHEK